MKDTYVSHLCIANRTTSSEFREKLVHMEKASANRELSKHFLYLFFKNIIREGHAHSTKLIMYFRTANHDHLERFAFNGAVHLRFASIPPPPRLTPGISIFLGG